MFGGSVLIGVRISVFLLNILILKGTLNGLMMVFWLIPHNMRRIPLFRLVCFLWLPVLFLLFIQNMDLVYLIMTYEVMSFPVRELFSAQEAVSRLQYSVKVKNILKLLY